MERAKAAMESVPKAKQLKTFPAAEVWVFTCHPLNYCAKTFRKKGKKPCIIRSLLEKPIRNPKEELVFKGFIDKIQEHPKAALLYRCRTVQKCCFSFGCYLLSPHHCRRAPAWFGPTVLCPGKGILGSCKAWSKRRVVFLFLLSSWDILAHLRSDICYVNP